MWLGSCVLGRGRSLVLVRGLSTAVAMLACGASYQARADETWVVGKWQGRLGGTWSADNGTRELVVASVSPDGAASAQWHVAATPLVVATMKVSGGKTAEISVPASGSRIVLQRDGDDRLAGTFTLKTGASFPITLTKAKSPNPFDGVWKGDAAPRESRCWSGTYRLTIKDGEIAGEANFNPAMSANMSAGGMTSTQTSTVTGEAWADGTVALALTKSTSQSRSSRFLATGAADRIQGVDKAVTQNGCEYAVTLKRAQ